MRGTQEFVIAAGAIALLSTPVNAQTATPETRDTATYVIDISARALMGSGLSECRIIGSVILWVSRAVQIADETGASFGAIEAGLAQFGHGSRLEGCIPAGAALDLSDRFANFLVADERALRDRVFGRREAAFFASLLAQDFYKLLDPGGAVIPLVEGIQISSAGSFSYRFNILLVRDAGSAAFDAVIHRETTGTKFAPRLTEVDRRLSRLKWSSVMQ